MRDNLKSEVEPPFVATTTNKNAYPFWPGNVVRSSIGKSNAINRSGQEGLLYHDLRKVGQTHYKETFQDPAKSPSVKVLNDLGSAPHL